MVIVIGTSIASAQTLNWEGQTGIFVTPLAYTAPSTYRGLGVPVVAYHYLDGGPVLRGFHQVSVTVGGFERLELGYTRSGWTAYDGSLQTGSCPWTKE